MEWQAVVLVVQILLLAVGWLLFQQARSELTARAAEMPVLSEVKALHRSVKQLLVEIEEASDRTSGRLEARCDEARGLLNALDARLNARSEPPQASPAAPPPVYAVAASPLPVAETDATAPFMREDETRAPVTRPSRREIVYALADAGESSAAIAQATGQSEGEVETLLGLRVQRG